MLGRRGHGRPPSAEELAGWALERAPKDAAGEPDPLGAMGLLRRIAMPAAQRQAATRLLRPLVTSIPLTAAPRLRRR